LDDFSFMLDKNFQMLDKSFTMLDIDL